MRCLFLRGFTICFAATAAVLRAEYSAAQATTPTLMHVRVSGLKGELPAEVKAEVMVLAESGAKYPEVGGRWKPVVNGTATILTDDVTKGLHDDIEPTTKYWVVARGRDVAPAFATVLVPAGATPDTAPLSANLTMKKADLSRSR